jgi:hypothetical protein
MYWEYSVREHGAASEGDHRRGLDWDEELGSLRLASRVRDVVATQGDRLKMQDLSTPRCALDLLRRRLVLGGRLVCPEARAGRLCLLVHLAAV